MLYLIHKRNLELEYKGGQSPIVHLVADLENTIAWANQKNKKWVFTSSNAGSFYFEDFHDLSQLNEIYALLAIPFGVMFATGITLLLVPCGYAILDDFHNLMGAKREVEVDL